MSKVQDYPSRLGDNSSRKFETFSYLPAMTDKQIREQVQYIVDQGYNPGVEHTEVENAMENYWYMWKLPMFGVKQMSILFWLNVKHVMMQILKIMFD